MGCCLFACIGAIWPRIGLVFLLLFTGIIGRTFATWYWPLLGFFFLPTTTLAYALCKYYMALPRIEDSVVALIIVGVAFLHDLGQLGMLRGSRDESKTPV